MTEAAQQIGIQMYTLRDQTERDFLGTLAKVAEMGYQAVEFAGYFGVSAGELRRKLDELGLAAPSAHVGLDFSSLDKMEQALAKEIEYGVELGLQYMITPSAPLPPNPSIEDVTRIIPFLEKASAMVRAAGMQYGYHNHDYEFKEVDGKAVIDIWLEQIPAEHMLAEFDLGWVYRGEPGPLIMCRGTPAVFRWFTLRTSEQTMRRLISERERSISGASSRSRSRAEFSIILWSKRHMRYLLLQALSSHWIISAG